MSQHVPNLCTGTTSHTSCDRQRIGGHKCHTAHGRAALHHITSLDRALESNIMRGQGMRPLGEVMGNQRRWRQKGLRGWPKLYIFPSFYTNIHSYDVRVTANDIAQHQFSLSGIQYLVATTAYDSFQSSRLADHLVVRRRPSSGRLPLVGSGIRTLII